MRQLFALVFDKDKISRIEELCDSLSIEFRGLSQKDMNTTIGSLIGISVSPDRENPSIPMVFQSPELMIFNGLSDDDLDIFLEEYKKRNIPQISLKGSVTPFNLTWSVYRLIQEYEEETKGL